MEDIRRVFMYHGAEHKCINCIEQGMDLTVENVKISSREHKRCGTSFLFFVVIITIIATMFIRVDSKLLRLVLRIAIIPLIAGISYEIIRFAGRSDHWIVNLFSKPGMWMQKLTTKEPDEEMPIATDKNVGGVMVKDGSGLKVDEEGYLSIDEASKESVRSLLGDGGDGP